MDYGYQYTIWQSAIMNRLQSQIQNKRAIIRINFFETTEESSNPIIELIIIKQLQKRLPFQTSKLSGSVKQKTSPAPARPPDKRLCNRA
jgi:hypothetical protein